MFRIISGIKISTETLKFLVYNGGNNDDFISTYTIVRSFLSIELIP